MRFAEAIKARKIPGHVKPRFLFRLPHVMLADYHARRNLSKELGQASKRAHDRFIVKATNTIFRSYNDCLQEYVLKYMPETVKACWEFDRFGIMLVSDGMMKASYAASARRNGEKVSKSMQLSVNGLYSPTEDMIYVKEGTFPFTPTYEKYCWQNVEDICGHEVGHYVDEIFDYPSIDDELFLEAYRTERYRVDSYAGTDNREYFATTCWICRRYPRIAQTYLPQTYHFFKVMFNYE